MLRKMTFLAILLASSSVWAQAMDVTARTDWLGEADETGRATLAVTLLIPDGWVLYSHQPGGNDEFAPKALRLFLEGGQGRATEIHWPESRLYMTDLGLGQRVETYVYKSKAVAFIVVEDILAGTPAPVVVVDGQLCSSADGLCRDIRQQVAVPWPPVASDRAGALRALLAEAGDVTAPQPELVPASQEPQPGEGQGPQWSMGLGLLAAVAAGLILNIMPCVLPVLPIRIMTIVDAAGGSRHRYVTLGLAYALGIVLFFVVLAGVNVGLHLVAGTSMDWGRHYQVAGVRITLAMVLVAVACNLFGLFNVLVPNKVAAMDSQATGKAGEHMGALGMGLMMAILATPCSFGFLLLVLSWAAGQGAWVGVLAFVLMGMGMAAPHALLTAFPGLVSRLPRPGRWMELLRQAAGFAIVIVAVYLVGTLGDYVWISRVGAFGVILAVGLWMWGQWVRYDAPLRRKLTIRLIAVALVVGCGVWLLPAPKPLAVEFASYSDAQLAQARAEGRIVVVKYTASWCAACYVVDRTIYARQDVEAMLAAINAQVMKVDLSNSGDYIPLPRTEIYPVEGEPVVLLGEFQLEEFWDVLAEAYGRPLPDLAAPAEAGDAPAE